jgi:hypothetical protein
VDPPTRQRRPSTQAGTVKTIAPEGHQQVTTGGYSWRDLLVEPIVAPDEKLAAPTLGAYRRRHGHTGWCEEARIAFAVELVQEAQRCILIEQLDGVMQFVAAGATPDQIVRRMERLVDDYHGRAVLKAAT